MTEASETWQPVRLIPVTGISGTDEQERRGASAFLAVLGSVKEFGRAITTRCGAPAGSMTTFIEVPFKLGAVSCRPDGLIRVQRGQRVWTALVEVKTGRNVLDLAQVTTYVDVAREQGFDAVLTISNELATTPGVHPVPVDKKKLKKVELHHLSWSQIHTEALIEHHNRSVSDPDQAWILDEFIRYLEYPKSGALDFDDMGASWTGVRDAVANQTVRATDKETLDVVAKFDQLVAFAGMQLARQLGVHVQPDLTRSERADPASRLHAQAAGLAKTGELAGGLVIPDAIAPVGITVDLRASRVDAWTVVAAPRTGRPATRVNWLVRQLQDAPDGLVIRADVARSRKEGPSQTLKAVREDPGVLIESPAVDLRSFTLTLSQPAGTKRGQGRGSFVKSVLDVTDRFYGTVVEHLKAWTPSAPKLKDEPTPKESTGGETKVAEVTDIDSATAGAAEVVGALPVPASAETEPHGEPERVSWPLSRPSWSSDLSRPDVG